MVLNLARRAAKLFFFLLIMVVTGRTLGGGDKYINVEYARKVAVLINGESNIESIYDAFFYIDFSIVISITIVVYLIIMKLIKIIRSS